MAPIRGIFSSFLQMVGLQRRGGVEQEEQREIAQDLLFHIFSYRSFKELSNAYFVDKTWRVVASDRRLWGAFVKVMDQRFWQEQVANIQELGIFGDEEQNAIVASDEELARFLYSTREESTLLTIPKGLSLNKLRTISGFDSKKFSIDPDIDGNLEVDRTYTVLLTNKPLNGTQGKTLAEQEAVVGEIGYQLAKTIEIAALCILTHVSSNSLIKLYSRGHYSRCQEGAISGIDSSIGFIANIPPVECDERFYAAAAKRFF